MTKSLDSLVAGDRGCLVSVGGEPSFRRRLMELGLLPGTAVRMIRRADVGGVLEVEVRSCRLSLRHREARQLFVTVGEGARELERPRVGSANGAPRSGAGRGGHALEPRSSVESASG